MEKIPFTGPEHTDLAPEKVPTHFKIVSSEVIAPHGLTARIKEMRRERRLSMFQRTEAEIRNKFAAHEAVQVAAHETGQPLIDVEPE